MHGDHKHNHSAQTSHIAQNSQNPFSGQKALPGIKHVIVVASGKGGVGKSTVAINLAVAMAKNHKVGLLDADIYGPSLPRMMGSVGQRPIADENGKIQPLERHGVKMMSIGFLIEDTTSVVWRGPMLFKAIDQFLNDVQWGELDYLVIDLPPGTGDVQLTLAQKIPITGAVVISTPQNIALTDVKKAIDMFERTQVPVLGVIENMSYMINPINGEKIQLFPKGELDQYLEQKDILKIGALPFNPQISMACEIGIPLLSLSADPKTATEVKEFFDICEHIEDLLADTPALSTAADLTAAAPAGALGNSVPAAMMAASSNVSVGGGSGGGCGKGTCGCMGTTTEAQN